MLDQETKKRIDDCRNILLGKVPDPKSQVEQITIAMIYKFMYDMDLESVAMGGVSTYFVGEYEKFSWGNIFNPRIGGNEMIELYGEGIVKMNLNPNIPQLFRDIFKNAYLPYRDPETLKLFLKGINEFHYSHSEKLGDAFEYLLSVLGSQGDAGQFRTPRHIIDFIVELLQPKKNERILDPACGTSGFLISSYKHILRNNTKKNLGDLITPDERNKLVENISGYDISPDMVRLSLVNLYLHNFSNPKIYEYDSLTSEDRWNEYYDVILANPPFMSPKGGIKPHKRFSIQSNRAEVLFIDYIMEHLTPKGRSGIVVPEGIIFQSGTAYKSLRKTLVEKYLVGVISLPSGVFQPYSGVKTSILILDKELSQKTDKIFFGKIDNDGYDLGSQRREIEKNDLPIIKKEVTQCLEALKKGEVVESDKLTYVTKEQLLSSSDIGLNYEKYVSKKEINRNYPMIKIGDFCETSSGGTPLKSREDFYKNGNIPWLRSGEVAQGAITKSELFISEEGLKSSSAKLFPVNTILVAMYGATAGQVGILKITSSTNQAICGILPNKRVIPDYLYYILKSRRQQFIDLSSGGAQPNISQNVIREFEIPLPPLEVQEEIVHELDQYQKIVDGAKQVVDNYKPIIEIDPSWEMKELGEVCEITSSKRIFQEEYVSEGIPFYRTKEIVELSKGEEIKTELFISIDKYNEIKSKYEIPKNGDILLSAVGTIGVSHLINDNSPFYFKDGNLLWIRNISNEIISSYFLKKSLDMVFSGDFKKYTNGAAYSALTIVTLKKISIPVPPKEIQQLIIEKIEAERQIIEGNKKLIENYSKKIQDRINKIWGE